MLCAILARDKPRHEDLCKATGDAHLDFLETAATVAMADPLLDDTERVIGYLIVLNVDNRASAEAWAAADPSFRAGLLEKVKILNWNKVMV